jgi:hypothetical protein
MDRRNFFRVLGGRGDRGLTEPTAEPDPPARKRPTKLWESYFVFLILLSLAFVFSPAVDAAREVQGRRPAFSEITVLVPVGPIGLLVALSYALILATFLTMCVWCVRRFMPIQSVTLPTMLITFSLLGAWCLCAVLRR